MGRRWGYPLAVVLGVAVAVLPGVAASESLPVEAVDEGIYYHHWSNSAQTVIAGESVKFANPYSEVPHGLKFTSGPATPACSGIPAAAGEASGATSWHGECSFATPGTYTFICTVHPGEMKGTITVSANGTTTVTTTTTPTPTTTTPSQPTVPVSPLVGAPLLRASQRGGVVKGALAIAKAAAGDELEIDVLARTSALSHRRTPAHTRVGHLSRGSVKAGRLSFSIRLDANARRALARRHRLALTVRIVLTPIYGEAKRINRSVIEHG
ncbi:MAG TPA: plastocyanin/azurin family copper-binding protein [Solirubrobacteraceae bacterium]|nr:plastocyanin/azurin family copper-binding protein [Solirubrobacteraceae bacterium]